MKVTKIRVPYYKWNIISVVIESYDDKADVKKIMKKYKMRPEDIDHIQEMFENESNGGALCYYNDSCLLTVIIVFPHTDTLSLVSTLSHESRHAADRIIDAVGLECAESAAYLNEYITTEMIKDYIKD